MTVSNAANRSRRVRTDASLSDLVTYSFLVMAKRAGFVECVNLKPDWLESQRLFGER